MLRILYIPLDERPCNSTYPIDTAKVAKDIEIIALPKELYGKKKIPANTKHIFAFIKNNIANVDVAVISTEMFLYGGLLPSRLHHLTDDDALAYVHKIKQLKKLNPTVKLFFSNLIMRTPRYNSSDEEPDYYQDFGEKIFLYGTLKDKKQRKIIDEAGKKQLTKLSSEIPQSILSDYETRRSFNVKMNFANVDLVKEGIIDFLSIPQDDSAPYGYTTMDQNRVYTKIDNPYLKEHIMVYPGADEVGFTLLARAYNLFKKKSPKIYVRYSSTLGPTIIPNYEDRIINESLKQHAMAAGFKLVNQPSSADFILAYNTPGKKMQESWDQINSKDISYDTYRSLLLFVEEIESDIELGRKVAICDCAYSNGGDLELIQLLDYKKILPKILSYKAWNTNCNTLGSSISSLAFCEGDYNFDLLRENLLSNIYEDGFYQALIRSQLTTDILPTLGVDYFDLKDRTETVMRLISKQMLFLRNKYLSSSFPNQTFVIEKLSSPWNRMFEIQCKIKIENGVENDE